MMRSKLMAKLAQEMHGFNFIKTAEYNFAEDETKVHSKIPNPSNGGIEDPDANKKWQAR